MSNYGADENPSIPAAQDLAFVKKFLPKEKTNVMQWTYPDQVVVRKLANKEGKSNALFQLGPALPGPPGPPPLDPVPAGDDCTVCWGDGKRFGVGETPSEVVVVIAGVEKGPGWMAGDGEPPNGTFDLTQDPGPPCIYRFENDDFVMFLRFAPINGFFRVQNKILLVQSFRGIKSLCSTFFENDRTDEFTSGTATIFIPPIA